MLKINIIDIADCFIRIRNQYIHFRHCFFNIINGPGDLRDQYGSDNNNSSQYGSKTDEKGFDPVRLFFYKFFYVHLVSLSFYINTLERKS